MLSVRKYDPKLYILCAHNLLKIIGESLEKNILNCLQWFPLKNKIMGNYLSILLSKVIFKKVSEIIFIQEKQRKMFPSGYFSLWPCKILMG